MNQIERQKHNKATVCSSCLWISIVIVNILMLVVSVVAITLAAIEIDKLVRYCNQPWSLRPQWRTLADNRYQIDYSVCDRGTINQHKYAIAYFVMLCLAQAYCFLFSVINIFITIRIQRQNFTEHLNKRQLWPYWACLIAIIVIVVIQIFGYCANEPQINANWRTQTASFLTFAQLLLLVLAIVLLFIAHKLYTVTFKKISVVDSVQNHNNYVFATPINNSNLHIVEIRDKTIEPGGHHHARNSTPANSEITSNAQETILPPSALDISELSNINTYEWQVYRARPAHAYTEMYIE